MPNIFLSHTTEDRSLASVFKKQIEKVFTDAHVFVSSEPDSIPNGDWLAVVLDKLNTADVFIPLITPLSEKSVWVIYEYGYFWGQKGHKNILPLYHPKANIPSPLNTLQAKSLTNPQELEVFFKVLSQAVSQPTQKKPNLKTIAAAVENISSLSAAERQLQKDLIYSMRSRVNGEAIKAIEELQRRDWLESDATTQLVFSNSDLRNAPLYSANLSDSEMYFVSCQNADFDDTNLSGSDLQDVVFRDARLDGTNFCFADLTGADLAGAYFDTRTTLPDGTQWTPETDMRRFTDPEHRDYWRPTDEEAHKIRWGGKVVEGHQYYLPKSKLTDYHCFYPYM